MELNEKVVVTGLGALTPVGNDADAAWRNIQNGMSGAGPITRFDSEGYKTRIACEVKDFDPCDYMDKRDARRHDRVTQYALVAAREAMTHAGLKSGNFDPHRAGVILGIGIGGFETVVDAAYVLFKRGPSRIYPTTIPKLIANMPPAQVAIDHQIYGPVYTVTTACTSSADAITNATYAIKNGVVDFVVTGGAEAPIVNMGIAGFNALQALSSSFNDEPKRASRPFDALRDGFVIGEGAVMLILESESHARKRGANILGEIVGVAATNDAFHYTAPHSEGMGIIRAIENALKFAQLRPEQIGYINAHGTSTKLNDRIETFAIKQTFGDHARALKVSSTKSMHGHMIGAAGAMEAFVCIQGLRSGFAPPTINYEHPDPTCDLDYVPNVGAPCDMEYAMSLSLGFGGHNGVIITHRA